MGEVFSKTFRKFCRLPFLHSSISSFSINFPELFVNKTYFQQKGKKNRGIIYRPGGIVKELTINPV